MHKIYKKVLVIILLTMCISVSSRAFAADYTYDNLNRVIRVDYENGSYVEYSYDANGNIEKINVYNVQNGNNGDGEDNGDNGSNEDNEDNGSNEIVNPKIYTEFKYPRNLLSRKMLNNINDYSEINKSLYILNIDIEKLPTNIRVQYELIHSMLKQKEQLSEQVGALTEKQILRILNID